MLPELRSESVLVAVVLSYALRLTNIITASITRVKRKDSGGFYRLKFGERFVISKLLVGSRLSGGP